MLVVGIATMALVVILSVFNGLEELNYPIRWHQYVMQHAVSVEELQDISQFIKSVFRLDDSDYR